MNKIIRAAKFAREIDQHVAATYQQKINNIRNKFDLYTKGRIEVLENYRKNEIANRAVDAIQGELKFAQVFLNEIIDKELKQ